MWFMIFFDNLTFYWETKGRWIKVHMIGFKKNQKMQTQIKFFDITDNSVIQKVLKSNTRCSLQKRIGFFIRLRSHQMSFKWAGGSAPVRVRMGLPQQARVLQYKYASVRKRVSNKQASMRNLSINRCEQRNVSAVAKGERCDRAWRKT